MNDRNRARLKLLGVMMVFLGPLLLAYLLYYGLSYGAAGTNGGELVTPAIPLPDITLTDEAGQTRPSRAVFEKKWSILQVAPDGCAKACMHSLEETRQIRALLHRRAARVQRMLITSIDQAQPDIARHPDLSVYRAPLAQITQDFDRKDALVPGMIYLVDPLGNWMLYYPPDGDGGALFKDIKHLLKLSHIG
jgi:hypothetical protein